MYMIDKFKRWFGEGVLEMLNFYTGLTQACTGDLRIQYVSASRKVNFSWRSYSEKKTRCQGNKSKTTIDNIFVSAIFKFYTWVPRKR